MIKVNQTVVVEGKYDKIKLNSIIDGLIIPTEGFGIYKDKEKQAMLRTLSQKTGLIVLTDSDRAGFQIRRFIKNICAGKGIIDVYIPDLYGKEKRKVKASKEGKLGVEGVPIDVVQTALQQAGIVCSNTAETTRKITKLDFLNYGLTGKENSQEKRAQLISDLNLPEHITTNSLILVLNALISYEEFELKMQTTIAT